MGVTTPVPYLRYWRVGGTHYAWVGLKDSNGFLATRMRQVFVQPTFDPHKLSCCL